MNRTIALGTLLAVALSGCAKSSSPNAGLDPTATPSNPTPASAAAIPASFPGGEAMAAYAGDPTYDWRVNLTNQQDYVRRELKDLPTDDAIAPLDDSAFERIVGVCTELATLKSNTEVEDDVRRLWSASPTKLIEENTVGEVFHLSIHWSCPSLGTRPAGVTQ